MLTTDQILQITAAHFGVTVRGIKSQQMTKNLYAPRVIAINLINQRMCLTFDQMAKVINRDRYLASRYCNEFRSNPLKYLEDFDKISKHLNMLN